MKKVIIIGAGLGALATALRLADKGFSVTILEKNNTPGGRLNILEKDGFRFDIGPSFMSMTYELDELFASVSEKNPVELIELDPLYQVFFEGEDKPYQIWKDPEKLADEFKEIEPGLAEKVEKYLQKGGEFFHDTEDKVIRKNFDNISEYVFGLTRVPFKHLPYLWRTMWSHAEKSFESEKVRIIFSLVAFFLGSTPFKTPAIYSLLNYTEMRHNGYWRVKGGMYTLVEKLTDILVKHGVKFVYNTEVVKVNESNGKVISVEDKTGNKYQADIFISNSDAASFRGLILGREKFNTSRLDKMHWTLAPFTIYLGVKGKAEKLKHHNYFLGKNFRGYADEIFTSSVSPQKPYYYVNVLSKSEENVAPPGCENIYILCPVPDLRFKKDWQDKNELAENIIADLSERSGFNIKENIITQTVMAPDEWEKKFNLYRGSGLGLAHDMNQVGAFRPKNKDEKLGNLYYTGASTIPGTGLPMVIISSRLVTERILNEFEFV